MKNDPSAFDLLTFENAQLLCRCPECGDFCPAWVSTENDYLADCPAESCIGAGSTFPILEQQAREFMPVLYECYPHLSADNEAEIRGFLTHNGEQELIIVTHPEEMKGDSLQGFCDYVYANDVNWWVIA